MTNRAPRVCGRVGALRLGAFASSIFIGDPGATLSDFSLVFFTRSGCHLCEDAEPLVLRLAARLGAALEVQDIDADPALVSEYSARVPVVVGPSGRVLAEGVIDERRLKKAIAAEQERIAL